MFTNEVNALTGTSAALFPIFKSHFESLLLKASLDNTNWNHRIHSFSKLSMLEFLVPSPLKPKPYAIDEDRLEDVRYRRAVIRKLKAPRPGKWSRQYLTIDKDRIHDDEYRSQMASILAYRFILLLSPIAEEPHVVLPLAKISLDEVEFALDALALNTIDSVNLARLLMHRLANQLIENNPTFKKVQSELKADLEVVSSDLRNAINEISQKHRSEFSAALDLILADVRHKADEAIVGIKERMEASAKRTQVVLDEAERRAFEDRDPQAAFLRDLKKRAASGDRQPWLKH